MAIETSEFNTGPITIRARWLFPVEGQPIRDGQLVVCGGQIVEIGPAKNDPAALDWGDCAVLPALVNAHTHLEFNSLRQPIGTPHHGFAEWIRQVVAWRRQRNEDSELLIQGIQAGLDESLAAGSAVVGEIATSPDSLVRLADTPASGIAFLELIGLRADRVAPQIQRARTYLPAANANRKVRPGISPHAPYTVSPPLLRQAAALSQEFNCPVAMHLAESADEMELLRAGRGPFVALLEELNAWDPAAIPPNTRPKDYLEVLAACPKSLVIHGNFLTDDELALLGRHADRMTLVYCPRTHDYFGHVVCPVERALSLGVRLALGTDSRASNPDLSIWKELQFAVRRHAGISPQQWLQVATVHGAEACGFENELGTLAVGREASFIAISMPPDLSDPWEVLADERCQVTHVVIAGQLVR